MSTVTMYSKRTCRYCVLAEQLLQRKGVLNLNKVKIDENPTELEIMITRTGRRSVPQIFIDDNHIGGFNDLAALEHAGELENLLNN